LFRTAGLLASRRASPDRPRLYALDETPEAGRAKASRTALVELMDDYKTDTEAKTDEEREKNSKTRNAHQPPGLRSPSLAREEG
jgi:hypothetical protein